MSEPRWRSALDGLVACLMLVAAGSLVWMAWTRAPEARPRTRPEGVVPIPREALDVSGLNSKGSSSAPLVMLEFSEFECPFCGRFARETLPTLSREYLDVGKVQLVFWHTPLPIHRNAESAAHASECAAQQQQFWDMHDRLFVDPPRLDRANLFTAAKAAKLDMTRFEACMDAAGKTNVTDWVAKARALGVTSTPMFFVGKRLADGRVKVDEIIRGALPVERFRVILDKQIASLGR